MCDQSHKLSISVKASIISGVYNWSNLVRSAPFPDLVSIMRRYRDGPKPDLHLSHVGEVDCSSSNRKYCNVNKGELTLNAHTVPFQWNHYHRVITRTTLLIASAPGKTFLSEMFPEKLSTTTASRYPK